MTEQPLAKTELSDRFDDDPEPVVVELHWTNLNERIITISQAGAPLLQLEPHEAANLAAILTTHLNLKHPTHE